MATSFWKSGFSDVVRTVEIIILRLLQSYPKQVRRQSVRKEFSFCGRCEDSAFERQKSAMDCFLCRFKKMRLQLRPEFKTDASSRNAPNGAESGHHVLVVAVGGGENFCFGWQFVGVDFL